MARSLKERLRAGETLLGAWCMVPSTLTAESLGRAGFDWVLIDLQHGCMGYETAVEMIRAVDLGGATPIVRAPWNEPGLIGRLLDAGALGVVVPMIETADDAHRAVQAALYPPVGRRSFGPIRVGMRDGPGYFRDANDRILVIPMIETASALAQVEAIAQTPGVDALFVGPFDLSISLGLAPGDNDGEPLFDSAIEAVAAAARRAGISTAVMSNATVAPRRFKQGFQLVSVATDISVLGAGARADLQASRKALESGASR